MEEQVKYDNAEEKNNEMEHNTTSVNQKDTSTQKTKGKVDKKEDKPLLALNIFALFFFLIGLIIYLAQKEKYPKQMQSLKKWLIFSFCVRIAIFLIRFFVGLAS